MTSARFTPYGLHFPPGDLGKVYPHGCHFPLGDLGQVYHSLGSLE